MPMKSYLAPGALLLLTALPVCAQAPANDAFASAAVIPGPGTVSGTNAGATSQTGEPFPHLQNANVVGSAPRTVWYRWSPAVSGLASVSVVAQGTGTAAVIMHANVYGGTAINALGRVAATTSSAGAAGPPATTGTGRPGNLFAVTAGVPVWIQVSGNTSTAAAPFDLTIAMERPGRVVLPMYAGWDWLHPVNGENPTADPAWATTWKLAGDATAYLGNPSLSFTLNRPAPFGFGGVDLAPGTVTNIGTAPSGTSNNAAYFRTTFTLDRDTSNLWAQVLADDGAYIYIDDLPGVPVRIAAALTNASFTTSTAHNGWRPQSEDHLTGAIPAANANVAVPGCRAYMRTGFDNEKQTQFVFLGGRTGKLSAGVHRVAVSVRQNVNTSSDMGFAMTLFDFDPLPLPAAGAKIGFDDVTWVNGSATATVIPVAEHHFAPNPGQGDLAWYMVCPDVRGTTPLSGGCVVSETLDGTAQKVLRLRDAEARRFVTEPVSVAGLAQFGAGLRVRTNDASSGFEAADQLRIFVELSTDGVNFAEPTPAAEIVPLLSGADLLTAFQGQWVTRSAAIATSGAVAARLVIEGGTDSINETIWFDDAIISGCLVTPLVTGVTYDHRGDNDRTNDQIRFTLQVDGAGNAGTQWTTEGFGAGSEVTSSFGAAGAVTISRPATDAAGARQNVVFRVSEVGNPSCSAGVTVTVPAAAFGTAFGPTEVTRLPGLDAASPDDDVYSFRLDPMGTALGQTWEARSADPENAVLYGSGTYGVPTTLTIPVGVASMVVIDQSDTTVRRTLAIAPVGLPVAMGRSLLGGNRVFYSVPGTVASVWRQGLGVATGDAEVTPDSLTALFNLGRVPLAGEGLLESESIPVAGRDNVSVLATLRAFESSTGSGFEINDTFRLEVELTDEGGQTARVNLINGHPADKTPADGLLNGFTGATAADYTAGAGSDEFNAALAPAAEFSRGTLSFVYAVPPGTASIRVIAEAAANSTAEYFLLKDVLVVAGVPGDADADGLPDAWELENFGNLLASAGGDPDGDGQNNAAEYAAGTVPTDGRSVLQITGVFIDPATRQATLDWASVPGKSYRVERVAGPQLPEAAGWQPVGSVVRADGFVSVFTDPAVPAGTSWFYRVRVVPGQ